MTFNRRNLSRPEPTRRIKKIFIIVPEGEKTEQIYFDQFNNQSTIIKIICRKPKHSAPKYLLKEIIKVVKEDKLRSGDEAWIVLDKDKWNENDINDLHEKGKGKVKYELAVSNPCFEYWLLLHFENGKGITDSNNCVKCLRKYIKEYKKNDYSTDILIDKIPKAIERAKAKDIPSSPWPCKTKGTTVYKLVESIIRSK